MRTNRALHIVYKTSINVCRFILSIAFLVSGFLKAIDPYGTERQFARALDLWHIAIPDFFMIGLSAVVAILEFVLGVYLFFGMRRKFTLWTMTLMLLTNIIFMAYLLTVGGAWSYSLGGMDKVDNTYSLEIGFVLLICAGVVISRPYHIIRVISEQAQWLISLYTILFTLALSCVCAYYGPLFGYGPYTNGTDLLKTKLEITDTAGVNVKDSLLRKGYVFLLVSPDLRKADDSSMDLFDGLYDYCQDNGYHLYGLAPKDRLATSMWRFNTGAAYTFYYTSEKSLNELSRANPTLLLLKDGRVWRKWSHWNFPDDSRLSKPLEKLELGRPEYIDRRRHMTYVLLWFILPILGLTFLDRIWALGVALIRIRKRKLNQFISINSNNMRKKIVAGNWKMNKNLQEGIELAKELNTALSAKKPNCGVVICTPFIHLASVAPLLDASIIGLGAENCADKESGAYTGEVSAEMVKSTGAQYVILGHSERRGYYHETAEILKEKVQLALKHGLEVIFCIGEDLETREANKQNEVVKAELEGSLFNLTAEEFSHIILAYEPIWAIGTGKTATPEQAEDMHAFIRSTIAEKFGKEAAEDVTILYGGSCKPGNAKELFAKPDIDGGLIGGASLKAADFQAIISAWD